MATPPKRTGGKDESTRMSGYQRKDGVYRAAKKAGLRSRAALKLEELDRRHRVFRNGQRVLDLGCWPGGWLQYASGRVGSSGRVVGIDLAAVDPLPLANVKTLVGDVSDSAVIGEAVDLLGGAPDVVLSDMAAKLTGVRDQDAARHERLTTLAVETAGRILVPRGALVIKLFSSVEADVTALLRERFSQVRKTRPDTTRKGSSEIYALASGPRGDS